MKRNASILFRIVATMVMVIAVTICFTITFAKNLKNHYLIIGETQAGKVSSMVTLNAVADLLKDSYSQVSFIADDDDLIFNTGELNSLLKDGVNSVYRELKKVETGTSSSLDNDLGQGIIYEVPFNVFTDNVLLSSFGPKIPVKYSIIGDVQGKMNSQIESFGINNALINIVITFTVSVRIALPMASKLLSNDIDVVVYSRLFNGEVPEFISSSIAGVDEQYSTEQAI